MFLEIFGLRQVMWSVKNKQVNGSERGEIEQEKN